MAADSKAPPKSMEKYPLHTAVWNGEVSKVVNIISDDIELIDSTDDYDNTPLHIAAARGHVEIVELLLGLGCEIDAINSRAWNPLAMAVNNKEECQDEIISILLDSGSDPDPALIQTSILGEVITAGLLISFGADVNVKGRLGTPIEIAAKRDYVELVELLLENGARVDIPGWENNIPENIDNRAQEVIRLIKENSAVTNNKDKSSDFQSRYLIVSLVMTIIGFIVFLLLYRILFKKKS